MSRFPLAFAWLFVRRERAYVLSFWEHAIGMEHHRAEAPATPFECTLREAQEWCNFVVLRPDHFPRHTRLAGISVRAETAQHPSSLRLLIEGQQRSLRLKQFFLDWWIPTSSDMNLTAPGRPFQAAGIVGYFGRDYKGQEAGCIHRYGALLELSVIKGHFGEAELTTLFNHLEPEAPEAIQQIAALPFARVSYYARKGGGGRGVWNYDLISGCRWSADLGLLRQEFPASRAYYPRSIPERYAFDSVGVRQEPASHHWEYQLLFRDQENLTDNLWLRAVGEETEKILWISPGLDRRMGIRLRSATVGKRAVRIGSFSEPHGERVAQWTENGIAFEVHARASLHLKERDFHSFLESLAPL